MKVKIFGAGSIGNHLANASVQKGWSVDICDIDEKALERTRNLIYPSRYGSWDQNISLYQNSEAPQGGYDLIFIGTPPEHHISLARQAVKEKPSAIMIEKPVCTPDLQGADELIEEAKIAGVKLFVGYDHAISKSANLMADKLANNAIGSLDTLDVEFREYWGGIFDAHPWLDGPADSYLGFWNRGGGACGEHSHALNLWQRFANAADAGHITEVYANLDYVQDGKINYDKLCLVELRTDAGLCGRVVQDVVTKPTRKWARAQGKNGFLEWHCGAKPGTDSVSYGHDDGPNFNKIFKKTRPDDFIQELNHIETCIQSGSVSNSPITLERGLDTMLVIAACHKSSLEGRRISIDYDMGYNNSALK
ncbi:MAG: Gfo/Idh/MocA family oxidoreductase [Alphaproteobacteria bacterium]|nr:Gfo/Idh/MocA family oxidoreductase [Alphaproteobacteria bacterium]